MPHECGSPNDYWQSNEWSRKSVLAFDGGGIKGYSSLLIARALMFEIARIERTTEPHAQSSVFPLEKRAQIRNPPTQPIRKGTTFKLHGDEIRHRPVYQPLEPTSEYLPCHYFDYITGSSTGGLIAIMLGRLGMTVDECLEEYERLAHRVFKHPRLFQVRRPPPLIFPRPKYDKKLLENIIKEIVRKYEPSGHKNSKFPQRNDFMCRTIITAYQERTIGTTRKPYLFRSYRHPTPEPHDILHRRQMSNRDDFPIWEVARATSAAPTYFESVKLVEGDDKYIFIDGGWGCNNPTEEVSRSIRELKPRDRNATSIVVSVGTGKPAEPSGGEKAFNSLSYGYYFEYIKSGVKQATDSEGIHDRVHYDTNRDDVPYFRLNVERDLGDLKLDAFKGKNGRKTLTLIQEATEAWLANAENWEEIRRCARLLVDIRRRRAHHQVPPMAELAEREPSSTNESLQRGPADDNLSHVTAARENWQDRLYLWERFVHSVEYRCTDHTACQSLGDQRYDRRGLRDHLIARHGFRYGQELEDKLDGAKKFPLHERATL